jgi:hypothetical protein
VVVVIDPKSHLSFNSSDFMPVYFHLLAMGWITQLIIGVAVWMFPTYSRQQPHGIKALIWVAYILLNLGLVLRAVGEPLNSLYDDTPWGWVLVASAIIQWLAGISFVVNIWFRVKER